MACPNKNRHRPRTVAFRLTDEEFVRLDQRVKVTGEIKGDYLRAMALEGEINICVGKYKSDKLALEIRKLSEALVNLQTDGTDKEAERTARESRLLIVELYVLISNDGK